MRNLSTEEILTGVVRALREHDGAIDLDALARDALDAAARAQATGAGADGQGQPAVDPPIEPLSQSARERIAARVMQTLATPTETPSELTWRSSAPGGFSRLRPKSVPGVRSFALVVAPLLGAAALIAGLVIRSEVDVIERYDVELQTLPSQHRDVPASPDSTLLKPHPGEDIEMVLRPRAPELGDIAVQAYIVDEGRPPVRLAPRVERSASAAFRLSVPWPEGTKRGLLVVVVGRPGALSKQPVLGAEPEGRGWQRIQFPYVTTEHDRAE